MANKKTVTIQAAPGKHVEKAVMLSTTKTKKQNTPAKLKHESVICKEFRKMAKAVKNQVSHGKCFMFPRLYYSMILFVMLYTAMHSSLL